MSKKSRSFSFELTPTADRVESNGQREIETGDLVSLNVIVKGAVVRKGAVFSEISVRQGGVAEEHTGATLIADYPYTQHHAAWTGRYPILQQSILHARIWSTVAQTIRITGTIEVND